MDADDIFYELAIEEEVEVEQTPDILPPNDYLYSVTLTNPDNYLWHLLKIDAQGAWDITTGSNSVIIASIDTDFDVTHPDLVNRINPSYDPLTNIPHSATGTSHGTNTISYAGAQNNGGGQLASIGWNTRLIAYVNNSSGRGPLDEAHHASFAMGADVITYSFTGTARPTNPTTRRLDSLAVKEILDNGTVIVRSAGNFQHKSDNDRYPFASAYDERIIIVSSTDKDDNHTLPPEALIDHPTYQTHGNYPEVDICAPGYRVMGAVSSVNDDGTTNAWPYYGKSYGTSDATPIAAGVCALMKSVNPSLTPAQVQDIIKLTAAPITDAYLYPGTVGAGRVNAKCAVSYSIPKNLTGAIGGTYRSYFINVQDAHTTHDTNLLGGEVTINGPFEHPAGYVLTIAKIGPPNCD